MQTSSSSASIFVFPEKSKYHIADEGFLPVTANGARRCSMKREQTIWLARCDAECSSSLGTEDYGRF